MSVSLRMVAVAALTLAGVGSAMAGDTFINASVSGVLAPGVYGRIDLGSAPPPPVMYPQPMIIQPPAMAVRQQPLYLYVPPGHAKNWAKHCHKYDACGRPVYFANVDERGRYIRSGGDRYDDRDYRDDRRYDDRDDRRHDRRGDDHGHGKGHGRGHGRD